MHVRRSSLALTLLSLSLVAQAPIDKPDLRLQFEQKRRGKVATASVLDRKARLAEREAANELSLRTVRKSMQARTVGAEAQAELMVWRSLGPDKGRWGGNAEGQNYVSGRLRTVVPHPTNPDILYVATAGGGVFKCTNASLTSSETWTWTPLTDTLPTATADGSISVGALAMSPTNPETLFLAMGDPHGLGARGFYTTRDGGATWVRGGNLGESTQAFEILPLDDQNLLVATPSAMFRTSDGARTFTEVIPGETIHSIRRLGTTLLASGYGKIFTSADQGRTWQQATIDMAAFPNGLARMTLATSPASTTVAYAMASDASNNLMGGVLKSTDGGRTWAFVNPTSGIYLGGQGWYNQVLAVDPDDINKLFIAGVYSPYRSLDGGQTWSTAIPSSNYNHPDFQTSAWSKTGPKALYIGHDGGLSVVKDVYRETLPTESDPSFVDHRHNQGLNSFLIYHVGSTLASYPADAKDRVSIGLQDNGTMIRQPDPTELAGSKVFQDRVGGDGLGTVIHPLDGNRIIASYQEGPLNRTIDGGQTWGQSISGLTGSGFWYTPVILGLGDLSGDTVFTLRQSGIHKSTDFGANFTVLPRSGMAEGFAPWMLATSKSNPNTLVCSDGGSTYLSVNGGSSWTLLPNPTNMSGYSNLWIDTSNDQVIYAVSAATGEGSRMWKSTDQGRTWKSIDGTATTSNGFPFGAPVHILQNDPTSPSTLYAGTDLGMYRSTNGGTTWSRLGSGFPMVAVRDFYLAPDGSFLRAGTWGRGLWEIQLKASNTVTTSITDPVADVTVDHRQNITFTGSAANGVTGSTFSYQWDFGDGTKASGQSVTKNFTNQGGANLTFQVRLTALDQTGASGFATRTITVKPGPDETAPTINGAWATGRSGAIQIQADATDNANVTRVEFYVDGTKRGEGVRQADSTVWSLDFDSKLLSNGNHRISAKAFDAAGNASSWVSPTPHFINNSFSIAMVKPTGTWGRPIVMVAGEPRDFEGAADPLAAGTTLTTRWTFGDGRSFNGKTTTHTYAIEGDYQAAFTVTDQTGFSESVYRNIPVMPAPESVFTEVESNNTYSTANKVASTFNVLSGALTTSTDRDHFAYTLQAGQEKTFALTGPKGTNYNLYLLSTSGTILVRSEGPDSMEKLTYKNTGTTARTVIVRVASASGSSAEAYRVEILNPSSIDGVPPYVNPIESTGTKGTVVLNAYASDNQGIKSVEYFVDGRSIGTATVDPFTLSWDTTTVANGPHQLHAKATDLSGNVGTGFATEVVVDNPVVPGMQEVEPNNTYSAANTVGTTVKDILGKIGTSTDQDHFKLTLAAGATLKVAMTGPATKDYDLYLLSSTGSILVRSENNGSTEALSYTNTGSTVRTVILRVKGYGGAYSTTEGYKLTLTR